MTNLMLIPESLTSGFSPLGLDLLSFGAILSGILVITAKNPVISVLFLISDELHMPASRKVITARLERENI